METGSQCNEPGPSSSKKAKTSHNAKTNISPKVSNNDSDVPYTTLNWSRWLNQKNTPSPRAIPTAKSKRTSVKKSVQTIETEYNPRNDLFNNLKDSDEDDSLNEEVPIIENEPVMKYKLKTTTDPENPCQVKPKPKPESESHICTLEEMLRPLPKSPVVDLNNLDPTDKRYYFYSEPNTLSERDKRIFERAAEIKKRWELTSQSNSLNLAPAIKYRIMKGLVMFVSHKKKKDTANSIVTLVKEMGGTVMEKFTSEVTHLIFEGGPYSLYKRARKQNCNLISMQWVSKCREANMLLPIEEYPIENLAFYEDESTKLQYEEKLKKQKKYREHIKQKKLQEEEERKKMLELKKSEPTVNDTDTETEPDESEVRKLTLELLNNCAFTRRLRKRFANGDMTPINPYSDLNYGEETSDGEKQREKHVKAMTADFKIKKEEYLKRRKEREMRRAEKFEALAEKETTSEDEIPLSRRHKKTKCGGKRGGKTCQTDTEFRPSIKIKPQIMPRKSPRQVQKTKDSELTTEPSLEENRKESTPEDASQKDDNSLDEDQFNYFDY